MAYAVAKNLFEERNCLIEAPTGIGKTVAYLVPAILFSRERNEKVVISTNTINLQEQLFKKDLPMLKKRAFKELKFSLLMGRNNYICLNKFYEGFSDNSEIIKAIEQWIKETKTGIKSDQTVLSDLPWDEVASDSDSCMGNRCRFFHSECFYYKAKRHSLNSDIIVTNHHLLISDFLLPSGRKIVPEHRFIIWDEAHHISDVATNQFGGSFSTTKLLFLINRFIRKEGGILHLLRHKISKYADNQFYELINYLTDLLNQLKGRIKLIETVHKRATDDRVIPAVGDSKIEEIRQEIEKVISAIRTLAKTIDRLSDEDSILFEKLRLNALMEKFVDVRNILEKFQTEDSRFVCFIKHSIKAVIFKISPIDVSNFLKPLFAEKTNILTSATLTTGADFSFIERNIAIENPEEIVLKSEFDWDNQVKAFLIEGISPADSDYSGKLEEALAKISLVVKGGILILFTSYNQMNKTYEKVAPILKNSGKNPIIQGDTPRYRLFEIMKETESILFGTSSFWEGIDLPGDNLSAVIITHLPFQSNNDPVISAKMRYYESIGLNSFTEFLLPDMILKLRQGVGRLIRKKTDRGVVIFLDDRLKTKGYGKTVRSSLQFDIEIDNIDKTVNKVKKFYE